MSDSAKRAREGSSNFVSPHCKKAEIPFGPGASAKILFCARCFDLKPVMLASSYGPPDIELVVERRR
jgi:hypothetical protein